MTVIFNLNIVNLKLLVHVFQRYGDLNVSSESESIRTRHEPMSFKNTLWLPVIYNSCIESVSHLVFLHGSGK